MSIDYAAVLKAIRPGALWTLNGNSYDGLTWSDESPKPTRKTLEDAWPQVEHAMKVEQVETERRRRYAAETDPLYFKAVRGDDGFTIEDWKAAVAAVQADLPYPVLEA